MYARLRPNRSPSLLPIRMNAAETSASSATAACTPLVVVSRSRTTAEIDTFISEVSMTNTNIAIASSTPRRGVPVADGADTPRSIADGTAHTVAMAPPQAVNPLLATVHRATERPPLPGRIPSTRAPIPALGHGAVGPLHLRRAERDHDPAHRARLLGRVVPGVHRPALRDTVTRRQLGLRPVVQPKHQSPRDDREQVDRRSPMHTPPLLGIAGRQETRQLRSELVDHRLGL